jgi:hypothetical protein
MSTSKTYWHPYALRRPMREIAARYPITYRKVGEKVRAMGFDFQNEPSKAETHQLMVAILAAMPPHVIPYGSMGDDTPWGEYNWFSFLTDLQTEQ